MKNKLLLVYIAVFLILSKQVISEQSYNMKLLANLNEHISSGGYSACWGYVAGDGREYAIIGSYDGTAFIDITDTNNIHEVDFLPGYGYIWHEMKVYDHYAYIVAQLGDGVQIADLQYLPDSVKEIGYVTLGGPAAHTISQSGSYLYLNGGSYYGVGVVDLSINPENPILRDTWNDNNVHDCRVVNDTIWACNGSNGVLSVIDATNKDNLSTITSWVVSPNNPYIHNVALTSNREYAYISDEFEGSLYIWDVKELSNTFYVNSWRANSTAIVHNIEIYDTLAIIAHYTAGIRVLNISDPENPVEIAYYDTYPSGDAADYVGCWGVYMFPSGKIIASDMQTGLYVVKIDGSTTNISNNTNLINSYLLEQNYPNPFNPSTTIKFTIPKNSFIKLTVYDVMGKEICKLVDEMKNQGEYEVKFNSDLYNLSNGLYFYKLEAGGFSDTKKLILLK